MSRMWTTTLALTTAAASALLVVPAHAGKATPPVLAFTSSPSPDYGEVEVGSYSEQTFTLTNQGTTGSAVIKVSLTPAGTFTIPAGGDTCTGVSLGKKNTCTVTVRYTPAGAGARDTATLTASAKKVANPAVLTLSGTTPNRAPVASDDSYTTDEDTQLTVAAPGVLSNDADADGDPLTVSNADTATAGGGSVSVEPDGGFTYTPADGFTGEDTFTYRANDGVSDSNVATVAITVTPVNQAPLAVDDGTYVVDVGATLDVSAPGVLDNDTDPDGDPLTAALLTSAQHGTVSLNADGSFTYVPNNTTAPVTDSFTYQASDGQAASDAATVQVIVNPYVAAKTLCTSSPGHGFFVGPGSNLPANILWGCSSLTVSDGGTAAVTTKIGQLNDQCSADGGVPALISAPSPSVVCNRPSA